MTHEPRNSQFVNKAGPGTYPGGSFGDYGGPIVNAAGTFIPQVPPSN
jgi:hypothetical protein